MVTIANYFEQGQTSQTDRFAFSEAAALNAQYRQGQQGAGALPAAVARTGGGCEIREPQPDGAAFQSRTEDIMQLAKPDVIAVPLVVWEMS